MKESGKKVVNAELEANSLLEKRIKATNKKVPERINSADISKGKLKIRNENRSKVNEMDEIEKRKFIDTINKLRK